METTTQKMTAGEFLDYLLGCRGTRELAVQLAYVCDQRRARRVTARR